MNLGAVLIGLAMLVVSVPFVAQPFMQPYRKRPALPARRVDLDEERLRVLYALRDLDFDFQVGKVSEDDYAGLRAQLVAEAARYLRDDQDDEIEALIQARRASRSTVAVCSDCGGSLEAGSRFCSQCGAPVEASCPSCGGQIRDGDLFCSSCGVKLTIQTETGS